MSLREYMAFKAGRAFKRGDTNFVDPSPTKGAIWLTQEDDGLVHFKWRNRETDSLEEDLIMFPGDAKFTKVDSVEGRVYVLKFSSSAERHFFWLQSGPTHRDPEFIMNINRILDNPDIVPVFTAHPPQDTGASSPPPAPAASFSATGGSSTIGGSSVAGSSSTAAASRSGPASQSQSQSNEDQLAQIRSLVASMTGQAPAAPSAPELSLVDVLTPQTLGPMITSHPELASSLFPFLPPDLPVPPSTEALRRVISSPQFRQAVASLDRALRTGMLQDLVRGLGLPSEAGSGVQPFLQAIADQARSQQSSEESTSMNTD